MIIVFAELCVEEVNGYLAEIIIMSINLWFDYMSVLWGQIFFFFLWGWGGGGGEGGLLYISHVYISPIYPPIPSDFIIIHHSHYLITYQSLLFKYCLNIYLHIYTSTAGRTCSCQCEVVYQ